MGVHRNENLIFYKFQHLYERRIEKKNYTCIFMYTRE